MTLSETQKKFLRGRAHALAPVVMIGSGGLTDGVVREMDRALEDHELVKVRVRSSAREQRDAMIATLAGRTGSLLVHRIGHVATYYRARREEPRMVIPDR